MKRRSSIIISNIAAFALMAAILGGCGTQSNTEQTTAAAVSTIQTGNETFNNEAKQSEISTPADASKESAKTAAVTSANTENSTSKTSRGTTAASKPAKSTESSSKPSVSKPSASAPSAAKPSAAAPSKSTSEFSAFQKKVVDLVNAERAKAGLKPLKMSASLNKTATLKSQDMAKLNYFDHNSPTYGSPFDMMKKYGISFRTAGENIAMGQTSPEQVMNGWMNSPGHRANILNSSYTEIGVGVAKNSAERLYWTQQFIG